MSQKSFEKRIDFIRRAVYIDKLTANEILANEFYIRHKCAKVSNDDSIKQFKEWLNQ